MQCRDKRYLLGYHSLQMFCFEALRILNRVRGDINMSAKCDLQTRHIGRMGEHESAAPMRFDDGSCGNVGGHRYDLLLADPRACEQLYYVCAAGNRLPDRSYDLCRSRGLGKDLQQIRRCSIFDVIRHAIGWVFWNAGRQNSGADDLSRFDT